MDKHPGRFERVHSIVEQRLRNLRALCGTHLGAAINLSPHPVQLGRNARLAPA